MGRMGLRPCPESAMLRSRLQSETTFPATGRGFVLVAGPFRKIPPEGGENVIHRESDDPGTQPHRGDRAIPRQSEYGFFVKARHFANGAGVY